jgi:hypothetical protein
MYIKACPLPSVIPLLHENDIGDSRCCQHSNDSEPKVESDIAIMIVEPFELVCCV